MSSDTPQHTKSQHEHHGKDSESESHQGNGHGDSHQNHHAHMAADFFRRFWISLALTIPILILSPMLGKLIGYGTMVSFSGDKYVLLIFGAAVYGYGGFPFTKGLRDEIRDKQPGMMTLIGLAVSVAFFYSAAVALGLPGRVFFWELATLIDIMLLGHWLEMRSVMGASKALDELADLMPDKAHRIGDDGETEDVSVDELEKGDRFLIKPGERIPADGRVVEGSSQVDESAVTGESRPIAKEKDDEVIGGTINQDGSLTAKVEKTGDESFLSSVVETVRKAQKDKSRSQNFADRAAFFLTIIAVSAGVITLAAWLIAGNEFVLAMERMVTVMVITCPHALGLAVPLVVAVTTSLAAKNGLLIRNRNPFEQARNIQTIVFDKTGTLTEGKFGLAEVVRYGDEEESEIIGLAAALEKHSEHPLAKGIVVGANDKEVEIPESRDFEAMKGEGVKGKVDGKEIMVVSPGYLDKKGIDYDSEPLDRHYSEGRTAVFVLKDGRAIGALALGDVIREESRPALEKLKDMGIERIMMTGDNEEVAKAVAETLDLDDYYAEVLPDDKAELIKKMKDKGKTVAMTGDGVNDAPALATADLGIAVGAGTDVAVETADVVLVRSDPRDIMRVFELSRINHRKMVQNLFWAAGYNIVAIPLAAGVLIKWGIVISPAVGAVLMSLSTVIVAFNAKLMRLS